MNKNLLSKKELITQKLYAIEALMHNARLRYRHENTVQTDKYIREAMKAIGELWLMWKTEDKKGKEWMWWE